MREHFILETLNKNQQIDVQEIVDNFQVSPMTARRDLAGLEKRGLLVRTHGGAVKSTQVPRDLFSYNEKVSQNQGRKEYICQLATQFIQDGDVIFIDSGSTLFYLCQHLKNFKNLIVITNSLPVVSELIQHDHIKINLIGGEIDNERKAVYGWLAENMLAQYHASKAFIGADGVSLQNGLTTYDEKEAGISRKLAFSADKVFLLCDSSKIEKNSYIKFAPLSVIDALITDADLVADVKADYEKQNVKIIN